mgnify:CR=1 FL=1
MSAEAPAHPVRPRHAASLILLRKTAGGPQVLMGRRPAKSRFAPDVFVFPGGRLDAADFARPVLAPLADDCVRRTGADARLAAALASAAIRETEEETGLTLANDHAPLTLAARAITPTNSPVRFHARFFAVDADLAGGQRAVFGACHMTVNFSVGDIVNDAAGRAHQKSTRHKNQQYI